jgi:RHS repeat-associated protein
VAELRYKPWGEARYTYNTTPTSYQFTGQRNDSYIGLYFYNARYYDPSLGRFLQADTIVPSPANPQTLNRYTYTRNNPIKYNDPTGHDVGCGGYDCGSREGQFSYALRHFPRANLSVVSMPTSTPTSTPTPAPIPTSLLLPTDTPIPTSTPSNSLGFISPFGPGVSYRTGLDFYGHPMNDQGLDMVSARDPYYAQILDDPTGHTGFYLQGYDEPLDSQVSPRIAGREVYAVATGRVMLWSDSTGFDLYTTIGDSEYRIQYAHVFPRVSSGDVKQETSLGYYARIGRSDIPHLHLSIRRRVDGEWQWVDPKAVLPR